MFGDPDLAVFFSDFAVTVQFGGQAAQGIFERIDSNMLADRGFGGFDAPKPTVKLPYNAFSPMPKELDVIVVDDINYTITERPTNRDLAIVIYALKVVM